nr:Stk1 family PASTA domain-containing Ser/Thr kinase [Raineyella antarctica]
MLAVAGLGATASASTASASTGSSATASGSVGSGSAHAGARPGDLGGTVLSPPRPNGTSEGSSLRALEDDPGARDQDEHAEPIALPVDGVGAAGPDRPGDGTDSDRTGTEESDRTDWADSGAYEIARATRGRRARRALVAALLVLVVALGAVGTWWLVDGRYVAAPVVTTMTQPQASAAVKAAGLEFATTEEYSETVPVGAVIATVPGPGEDIARGATLTAVLSKGPERYAVPAVVGKPLDEARQALDANHLAVGTVTEHWSETVAQGTVVSAATQEGTSVKPGTPVDLVVSKGREPITVKNWYNRNSDDAIAALAAQGLKVVTTSRTSDQVAAGKVLGQTPSEGTLYRGDKVTVAISQGPEKVTVPDVKGKSVKDAEAAMAAAGFRTTTQPVEVNYLGLGFVARSSAEPGTQVAKGSTITLFLV